MIGGEIAMRILARLAGVGALVLALAAPAFSQTLLNVVVRPDA